LDRLRPLVFLKLRLALRQARGPWGIVGLILMLLFFVLPFGLGLAAFVGVGLETLEPARAGDLRCLVLTGVWVFWIVFPLVGFSLNQSYDLTRLFVYPLHRRTIFLANLLACFLDPTLLLVLPAFVVLVALSCPSVTWAPVAALALILFLAQTLALSQAVLWGLLNILRSRRTRDWALLMAPLLGLAVYLGPQLFIRGAMGTNVFATLVSWQPSRYLWPTPPGLAAGALEAAQAGRPLEVALCLLGSAAYLALTVLAGGWILGRLYTGEIGLYGREAGTEGRGSRLQRLATTPLAALALKEARYYWRDPRHKAMFLAPLFPLAVVLAGAFTSSVWTPPAALLFVTFVCFTGFASNFQNIFGVDREGLRLLFVTPCSREDILIGKNLAGVAVASLVTGATVVLVGIVLHEPRLAALCAAFVFPLALIMAAVGNVTSIHFPVRMARRGENPFTSSSGSGCLMALVNLAGTFVAWVAALPVLAGAALPTLLHHPTAYAFTTPGASLYAGLVYVLLLRLYTAGALQRNETRILEELITGEPG
jgi:hypothetical protein